MSEYRQDRGRDARRVAELEAQLTEEMQRNAKLERELDTLREPPPERGPSVLDRTADRVLNALLDGAIWLSRAAFSLTGVTAIILIAGAAGVGWLIYDHEVNDIRAGYVRAAEHHPAYTSIECPYNPTTRTAVCTPTHHPERWSVRIARGNEGASWDISEADYERLRVAGPGGWYCTPRATVEECAMPHEEREPGR